MTRKYEIDLESRVRSRSRSRDRSRRASRSKHRRSESSKNRDQPDLEAQKLIAHEPEGSSRFTVWLILGLGLLLLVGGLLWWYLNSLGRLRAVVEDPNLPFEYDSILGKYTTMALHKAYSNGTMQFKSSGNDRGHFWKVTPTDGGEPILLFGTSHPAEYPDSLALEVQKVAKQHGVKTIVTEVRMRAAMDMTMDAKVVKSVQQTCSVELLHFETDEFHENQTRKVAKFLGMSMEELLKSAQDEIQMMKAGDYACGDPMALILGGKKLQLKSTDAFAAHMIDRNMKWWGDGRIFQKRTVSHDSPTMLVVGASHLYGSNGLLNLSRKVGWKVERCNVAWPRKKFHASKCEPFRNMMDGL